MGGLLHRKRNANILSVVLFLLLAIITVVMVLLPTDQAFLLLGIWNALAIVGTIACLYSLRIRWKQRAAVVNPHRQLPDQRRAALRSIANANVRREAVRAGEFALFLFLGIIVVLAQSTPEISRAIIVLFLILLLGNVLYDLIEIAYTDQFFESAAIDAAGT